MLKSSYGVLCFANLMLFVLGKWVRSQQQCGFCRSTIFAEVQLSYEGMHR